MLRSRSPFTSSTTSALRRIQWSVVPGWWEIENRAAMHYNIIMYIYIIVYYNIYAVAEHTDRRY